MSQSDNGIAQKKYTLKTAQIGRGVLCNGSRPNIWPAGALFVGLKNLGTVMLVCKSESNPFSIVFYSQGESPY